LQPENNLAFNIAGWQSKCSLTDAIIHSRNGGQVHLNTSDDLLPRAALRVGITGHRKLTADQLQSLQPRLSAVLKAIAQTTANTAHIAPEAYSALPVLLRATSPMAEGADRLFGQAALDLGYELQCPLPFAREEYCKDFNHSSGNPNPASIAEFNAMLDRAIAVFELDGVHGDSPYVTVGDVVLSHSDILVAIWDGASSKGAGGTAEVVERARVQGIPVFWLETNTNAVWLSVLPEEKDSKEEVADGKERPGWAAAGTDIGLPVSRCVKRIMLPPWLAQPKKSSQNTKDKEATSEERDLIPTFGANCPRKTWLSRLWNWFVTLMTLFAKNPKLARRQEPWQPDPFEKQYNLVNSPAIRLAGQYRGAFLLIYGLGLAAVMFALLSYAAPGWSEVWVLCELTAVLVVFYLVWCLRTRLWHDRSVDCRYLAEQLRILRYLYPLGLGAIEPVLPAHHMHGDLRESWMQWRLKAIMRATSLPDAKVTPEYLGHCYKAILDDWVDGQIDYHDGNENRMHTIEHRLHKMGVSAIVLAFLACVVELFLHVYGGRVQAPALVPWVIVCAAGLPALAATCHGISNQGEFRRLAERSGAMRESLEEIKTKLEKKEIKTAPSKVLRQKAELVGQKMLAEVLDWQILYRRPVPTA
jgi:hypothetical protein